MVEEKGGGAGARWRAKVAVDAVETRANGANFSVRNARRTPFERADKIGWAAGGLGAASSSATWFGLSSAKEQRVNFLSGRGCRREESPGVEGEVGSRAGKAPKKLRRSLDFLTKPG